MPNYSVCIDSVFGTSNPIRDSLKAVRDAGFDAFEFWEWWNRDLGELKAAAQEYELTLVGFVSKHGSLVEPLQRKVYLSNLRESLEAAKELNCKSLITQTGNDTGNHRKEQKKSIIDGLLEAVPMLEEFGITLLLEPLNTLVDHKGYYLWQSTEAYEIVDAINSPYVKVLFDIYHQQIMEGNLIRNIQGGGSRVAHFHAAGNPGRNEPYIGEINYPAVIDAIEKTGYSGYIGLEYFPLNDPAKSLKQVRDYLIGGK